MDSKSKDDFKISCEPESQSKDILRGWDKVVAFLNTPGCDWKKVVALMDRSSCEYILDDYLKTQSLKNLIEAMEIMKIEKKVTAKKPVHADDKLETRKRRAAKQQAAGDETVRPVKREDNSTHDDKTVSMDKFWDEKAAEMGIAFEKDGDKTKVTIGQNQSFSLSDYEGSVKDGPPLPEQYVAEFLKENKPDCEKALAWCKALAARDLAAGTSMTWDGASVTSESYNYDKTESEPDPEPKQRVNPVLLRLDEKLAKKQQRRHRKKENAKGRPNGTIKKEMSRPGKAPNSVPEPMGLHKTPAVADEMAKKREIHPDVMARVQAASMKLQKAMFGDEGPSKMESNDKKF